MIQNVLWVVSFFSLWLIIVWLQVMYLEEPKKRIRKDLPSFTIAVAAYNEEKTIEKTVSSIAKADYPKEKIEVIIVNDGSTDKTAEVIETLIKKYKELDIQLINKKNGGKASAINIALKKAKGELFGVVDADSRISTGCMKIIVKHFYESNVGAVISRIKVDKPNTLLERIQRFEYIMSNMIRKLMAAIGTLAMTPGVLSVYRTEIIRKLGGFDQNKANLTEDLEIAMRLKYHGYDVDMEPESIVHTVVPPTLKGLWRQRIRWARGYIYNHWKYRSMFFSRKHSLFGLFQMPVNIIVLMLLIVNISILSWIFLSDAVEFVIRSITIEGYFMNSFFTLPSLRDTLLGQNLRIIFPVATVTLLGFYLIFISHRIFKERLAKHILPIVTYFIFVPYFMTLNWISSITQEVFNTKKKW